MSAIHSIGADRATRAIRPRSFVETVERWEAIYHEMRLVRDPVIDEAYAWVREHEPGPIAPSLVHGDYRIGNCLTASGRVTGILDWELSFVGDSRFDLGYMALEYHAGKFAAPGSTLLNAVADHAWFYERYAELTGSPVDLAAVRTFTVLGALMLFAIMSTGVRLYAKRETTDIRRAWGRFVLPGLRQDLAHVMEW